MAVYIDDGYKFLRLGRMKMSHMGADNLDELLAMADKIGLKRKYLQDKDHPLRKPHFDVCLAYRKRAFLNGAIPITMQRMVQILRKKSDD